MIKVGVINTLFSVACAKCKVVELIEMPLSFNQPSLSFGIEYMRLMETMDDAGMTNTDIGWMHTQCALDYLKGQNKSSVNGKDESEVAKKEYSKMSNNEKIEELEAALIDLLGANRDVYAIQDILGSIERAEEILELFHVVEREYMRRHEMDED